MTDFVLSMLASGWYDALQNRANPKNKEAAENEDWVVCEVHDLASKEDAKEVPAKSYVMDGITKLTKAIEKSHGISKEEQLDLFVQFTFQDDAIGRVVKKEGSNNTFELDDTASRGALTNVIRIYASRAAIAALAEAVKDRLELRVIDKASKGPFPDM